MRKLALTVALSALAVFGGSTAVLASLRADPAAIFGAIWPTYAIPAHGSERLAILNEMLFPDEQESRTAVLGTLADFNAMIAGKVSATAVLGTLADFNAMIAGKVSAGGTTGRLAALNEALYPEFVAEQYGPASRWSHEERTTAAAEIVRVAPIDDESATLAYAFSTDDVETVNCVGSVCIDE